MALLLVEQLKQVLAPDMPGPVAVCLLRSAGVLALERPGLTTRILPVLFLLPTKYSVKYPEPGDGQGAVQVSA